MSTFTDAELNAFLDEALPPSRSSELEHRLRSDPELRNRLLEVRGRDSAGLHTIGSIWRRNRLSCPTRSELGQFLLETLDAEAHQYIQFHLDIVGCRYCSANVADLREASRDLTPPNAGRRQRYFQTSAGYLRRNGN